MALMLAMVAGAVTEAGVSGQVIVVMVRENTHDHARIPHLVVEGMTVQAMILKLNRVQTIMLRMEDGVHGVLAVAVRPLVALVER